MVLNQVILSVIPDVKQILTSSGIILVSSGIPSQLFGGLILNRLKNHRLVAIFSYLSTLLFFISFSFSLFYKYHILIVASCSVFGFFGALAWLVSFENTM